ncbi:MAG: Fic family protein/DNA-binding XRE family transcriptional regulator [Cyclobacteriaceae bacterium]|jgi:Fic family protein/DNA-binding XRE family transcriptional regulator
MLHQSLKQARIAKALKLREVASFLNIDQALISKFEKGDRVPTWDQLTLLSKTLSLDLQNLKTDWLADKIVKMVQYEPYALEVLAVAESRVEYLVSSKTFDVPEISLELNEKLDFVDQLKRKWAKVKPLNQTQLAKMKEFFNVENTFESNRIEGNTLSLQETHLVVNEGLTIGGKSMREHLEAVNHIDALGFIEELIVRKEDVTKRNLLELHSLILKGVDTANAGVYRSVPVRISGSRHEPVQPYLLDKLMEDFFLHYKSQKNRLHPVILAAEVHERLVSIHPFIDGNGRFSRLLMNMVLLQNGYTLTHIKGDTVSRLAYYRSLEDVQVNNNPEPFYELVIDSVIHSLQEHLKMV